MTKEQEETNRSTNIKRDDNHIQIPTALNKSNNIARTIKIIYDYLYEYMIIPVISFARNFTKPIFITNYAGEYFVQVRRNSE